jgi:hypothetical protein
MTEIAVTTLVWDRIAEAFALGALEVHVGRSTARASLAGGSLS